MRIAVVGVGGVGGYFGARLIQAGHEVYLLARGAHLAAIQADGLRLESPVGDALVRPAGATADPATVGPVDYVLVAVKSWQLAEAARSLTPLLGPQTAVVPLLNGVEAGATLAELLGPQYVLGGLCRIMAEIAAPGLIRHHGIVPSLALGEYDQTRSERVEALRAAFAAAGVQAEIPPAIEVAIWQKFLLICSWSGLGAITRAPIGVWRSLPGTRMLAEQVLAEVAALAAARGIALPSDAPQATLAFLDSVPAAGTASMQRDLIEGRRSELEAQSGAVVRLGAAAGVPTPVNGFIYHCLLPQEQAARGGKA